MRNIVSAVTLILMSSNLPPGGRVPMAVMPGYGMETRMYKKDNKYAS